MTEQGLRADSAHAGRFLTPYVEMEIYAKDPFEVLDRDGVGKLMRIAVEKGRSTRPGIKLGICGEHGGEPSSVEFCHMIGLNYVSCSPFRVPIARLAAARAALKDAPQVQAKKNAPAKKAPKPIKKTAKKR